MNGQDSNGTNGQDRHSVRNAASSASDNVSPSWARLRILAHLPDRAVTGRGCGVPGNHRFGVSRSRLRDQRQPFPADARPQGFEILGCPFGLRPRAEVKRRDCGERGDQAWAGGSVATHSAVLRAVVPDAWAKQVTHYAVRLVEIEVKRRQAVATLIPARARSLHSVIEPDSEDRRRGLPGRADHGCHRRQDGQPERSTRVTSSPTRPRLCRPGRNQSRSCPAGAKPIARTPFLSAARRNTEQGIDLATSCAWSNGEGEAGAGAGGTGAGSAAPAARPPAAGSRSLLAAGGCGSAAGAAVSGGGACT